MELYHITQNTYQVDDIINSRSFENGETHYYANLNTPCRHVEDILEAFRPECEAPRKCCIFAFAEVSYCSAFMHNQAARCYRVDLNACHGHPMVLVNHILNSLSNKVLCERLAKEYWQPRNDWKFLEYIGTEMRILEEVPRECFRGCSGKIVYQEDFDLANRLFKLF